MRLRPQANRASQADLIGIAAFHSPLVADAGAALADRLARAPMYRPALPVWSKPNTSPDAVVVVGSPGDGQDGLRRRWLAAGAAAVDSLPLVRCRRDPPLLRWGA